MTQDEFIAHLLMMGYKQSGKFAHVYYYPPLHDPLQFKVVISSPAYASVRIQFQNHRDRLASNEISSLTPECFERMLTIITEAMYNDK